MKRLTLLCIATLALGAGLNADQTDFGAGSQAAPWLKVPASARVAGLAGAGSALAEGVDALAANPAGLAGLQGSELGLFHHAYLAGTAMEHLGYATGLGRLGGAGAAFNYVDLGAVDRYSVDGGGNLSAQGSYRPSAWDLDLGWGRGVGAWQAGAGFKLVEQSLDGSSAALAAALGLGIEWQAPALPGLRVAADLQGLGTQLDGANLPLQARVAGAYGWDLAPRQRLALALDLGLPTADAGALSLSLGAELRLQGWASLRAGYQMLGNGGASGPAGGLGVSLQRWSVDYALSAMGDLGLTNMLSLAYRL